MSLRIKLLLSILLTTLIVWGGAAYFSFLDTKREIDQLFDAHLSESAKALLVHAKYDSKRKWHENNDHDDDDDDDDDAKNDKNIIKNLDIHKIMQRGGLLEKSIFFQIWDMKQNKLLPSSSTNFLKFSTPNGFSSATIKLGEIRLFSQWNQDKTLKVVVAESLSARSTIAKKSIFNVLKPILWSILPLLFIIGGLIEWSLAPLKRLLSEIDQRSPRDLNPIEIKRQSKEINSITIALNSLLSQLQRALDNERRFTSDASHELRTPLAAIKVQAQVALKETNQEKQRASLNSVVLGVNRATHLVNQLLILARLDPEKNIELEPLNLSKLIEKFLEKTSPMSMEKSIKIAQTVNKGIFIDGNETLLSVLIRNIIDNSVRYCPKGSHISIDLSKKENKVILKISDNGPGLNKQQLERLGQKFIRLNRSGGDGCGLGLAIVYRIAELHQADILIENELGLHFIITFESVPPKGQASGRL